MVKDVKGEWVEIDDAVFADAAKAQAPWYTKPELWGQIAIIVGLIFNGWKSTTASSRAADARDQSERNGSAVNDVKREVQTQLPPLTGRPPVTAKAPE